MIGWYQTLGKIKGFQKMGKKKILSGSKLGINSPKVKILGQNNLFFEFWAFYDAFRPSQKKFFYPFLKALGLL